MTKQAAGDLLPCCFQKGGKMKLHNKSSHPFQHSYFDENKDLVSIEIKAGEIKEIDDKIAKVWLKTGKVVEFVEPQEAKEEKDELLKEIEKLKAENAKLKAKDDKPKAKEKGEK